MSLDGILRNAAAIAVEVAAGVYIVSNIFAPGGGIATRAYHPQQDSRAAIAYQQKGNSPYQRNFELITRLDAIPPQGGYVVRIPRMTKNVSGEVLEEAEKLPPNEEYEKLKKEAMHSLWNLTIGYQLLIESGHMEEVKKDAPKAVESARARYELGKLMEEKFGVDGYNELELYLIRDISTVAGFDPKRGYVPDMKKMVENKTYRSNVVYAGNGRLVELLVLASDPNRAEWYFKAFEDIVPLAEDYTGLKYPHKVLTVHSQHVSAGISSPLRDRGITIRYPDDISSVWAKAVERDAAHEFDHVLKYNSAASMAGMPQWLSEGKAEITGLAVLNGGNLPRWGGVIRTPIEENFKDYYNRRARGNDSLPPSEEVSNVHEVTITGEVILLGLLRIGGPDYLRNVIREVNETAKNEFVSSKMFAEIAMRKAPRNLESRVRAELKARGVFDYVDYRQP